MAKREKRSSQSAPTDTVAAVSFSRSRAAALRHPRYGNANPDFTKNDFWDLMIRQRRNAYWARTTFGFKDIDWPTQRSLVATSAWREWSDGPVFCFTRFGRTVTQLPDGRIIYIGGEHEDWYDPDFCIYNDVVVEDTNGELDIHLYPKDTFPPTDFHTATLVGNEIYLIGSLGYVDMRRIGETQVYVLDTVSLKIEVFPAEGDGPGWISRHNAEYDRSLNEIRVTDGQVAIKDRKLEPNVHTYFLDLDTGLWRSSAAGSLP